MQQFAKTATQCNMLQHTEMHCKTWDFSHNMHAMQGRYTATHCNMLQHTANHCNTLQHTATHETFHILSCSWKRWWRKLSHCNTLQHTATHCNTRDFPHLELQWKKSVTKAITLQYTATLWKRTVPHETYHILSCSGKGQWRKLSHCSTLQHSATNCNAL